MYGDYPDFLVLGLWAAWALYWLGSAANVKNARQRESGASRTGHRIPMLLSVALLMIPPFPAGWILFDRFVPRTGAVQASALLLVFLGLSFSVWARVHLGRNWSGRISVKQDHTLIRTGPYAQVRHPIYFGLLLAIAGTALIIGEIRGLLALLFMCAAYWRKLLIEERWMIAAFGDDYRRYREHTAALVPFIL